jgi:hypothetical protein
MATDTACCEHDVVEQLALLKIACGYDMAYADVDSGNPS